MNTSPATPTGTGHSAASSTSTRIFGNGDPIGGASAPPGTHLAVVAITVASVGPYVFVITDRPAHLSTSAAPTRSDPTTQCRTPGTSSGSNMLNNDGLTLAATTPLP